MSVALSFLGAAGTVTGSRYLLEHGSVRHLVDCGLFQGVKALRERNWRDFATPAPTISSVVLTHAHLDHSGYLPALVRAGFAGRVFASAATQAYCEVLLRDSARLQEQEAEYANRRGFSKHKPAKPLYTMDEAEQALERFDATPFHTPRKLAGGAQIQLARTGHILGAASVALNWNGITTVFSGDLGRYDDPTMLDPEPVAHADYLVIESTYGDRRHAAQDPEEALRAVIEKTAARGGTVVIPAFAVGRAQTLLYHLWRLKSAGHLQHIPIFLDSPMAVDASEILCRHHDDQKLSLDICRRSCAVAKYVRSVEESKQLNQDAMPKVIVSASGMATGGRVLHHLKRYAPDARSSILFSGYQAPGTRGASIVNGAEFVKIHGEYVPVRADVASLSMLSAHADASEIIRWLKGFRKPPKMTFITHGEPASSDALRVRIKDELGWSCKAPEHLERVDLT